MADQDPRLISLASTNPIPSPDGWVLDNPWGESVAREFYTNLMSYGQLKLNIPVISNILLAAELGNPIDQALLFKVVQEKEPILTAHLQTRKLAILGKRGNVMVKAGW